MRPEGGGGQAVPQGRLGPYCVVQPHIRSPENPRISSPPAILNTAPVSSRGARAPGADLEFPQGNNVLAGEAAPGGPKERGFPEDVLGPISGGSRSPPSSPLSCGHPRALDLFTGTGSVAKRLKDLGYEVTTLDIDPKVNAHITQDVMQWNYRKYPGQHFQLIAASVPCNEYSIAKTR